MAKKEMSRAESRYAKDRKDERKGEEHKVEKKAEDAHDEAEGMKKEDAGSKHVMALREMHKRHQREHRDLHGLHKDAMKSMFDRHAAEMKQMHAGMESPAGNPDGDMDQMPAEGAPEE